MKVQTKLQLLFLKNSLFSANRYDKSETPRIWIFLGADYGNLGDIAITLYQEKFLKNTFRDHEVVVVPISATAEYIPSIKKVIKADDIITIVGGGNMTDLYGDIEFLRQLVIKSFPRNKIISFPQSIYLTPTKDGVRLRKRIAKIYGSHGNLQIMMRDRRSFSLMKEILPNGNIQLAPDIVMLGNCREEKPRKKQVAVCIRKDKEATKDAMGNISSFIDDLQSKGYNIVYLDTQVENRLIKREGGEVLIKKLLDVMSNSSLVITNRLHGMIFAFITGTPAVVLDNSTGKVSSTYDWIKDCGYIHLGVPNKSIEQLSFTDNFAAVNQRLSNILKNLI